MTRFNLPNPRLAWLKPGTLLIVIALAGCRALGGLPRPPSNPLLPTGVIYQDDFEQENTNWDASDDGIVAYGVKEGRLVVTVNDFNASAWSSLSFGFDNFILEVETLKLGGPDDNGFGVLFRYQDPANYYRFDISSDGFYSLGKTVEGTFEVVSPWNANPVILTGELTNRLHVVAQGSSFSFAVNDTPLSLCVGPGAIWDPQSPGTCLGGQVVEVWTDDTFANGQIALGVTAFQEAGPSIGFDNLVISEP